MKPSIKFMLVMGLIMSFVVGAVMSVYMMLYNGAPLEPMPLLINLALATVIGVVVCVVIPVAPLGSKLAIFYGSKPGDLLHGALQAVVINTIMTFCISFGMTAFATGFATFPDGVNFFMRWLDPIPTVWGIAFMATFLTMPIAMTLARKADGQKAPMAAQADSQ